MKKHDFTGPARLIKTMGIPVKIIPRICPILTYSQVYPRMRDETMERHLQRELLKSLEAFCITYAEAFASERKKLDL